ncbi:hypothetical protein ONZ45_g15907 [Pleurotus djamor]|nr:hypothetical protein ONZ45_g15907 [Pleurotus djamor]
MLLSCVGRKALALHLESTPHLDNALSPCDDPKHCARRRQQEPSSSVLTQCLSLFSCLSSNPTRQGDGVPINRAQCLQSASHPESLMTVIDIRRQTPSLHSSSQEETSEESAVSPSPRVESTQPAEIKESFVTSERPHVIDDNNSDDAVFQEAADASPRFPKSRKIITDFSAFDTPQASPHPHMNEFAVLRPPPIEHKGLVVSRYTPSELEGSVCSAHGASPCNLCSLSKANLPIKFPF